MGVVLGLVCGLPGRPRNRPHRARIGQRSDPTRRGMVGPRPGLPVGLSLRPPPRQPLHLPGAASRDFGAIGPAFLTATQQPLLRPHA